MWKNSSVYDRLIDTAQDAMCESCALIGCQAEGVEDERCERFREWERIERQIDEIAADIRSPAYLAHIEA